jgi:hypothetical protein
MPAKRDENGLAEQGSQLQMAIYANARRTELDGSICAVADLPIGVTLDWRSPLRADRYAEYQDAAFLTALGRPELSSGLREFWPAGGPVWDGLAVVDLGNDENGVLMVEAKSYPEEMYGSGSQAGKSGSEKALANRDQIARALERTQAWTGSSVGHGEAWMVAGPDGRSLYQLANRLAHLYWLRELREVPAWFVQVLFVDDPYRQTSEEAWRTAIADVWTKLGIDGTPPHTAWVTLPAGNASELASSSA